MDPDKSALLEPSGKKTRLIVISIITIIIVIFASVAILNNLGLLKRSPGINEVVNTPTPTPEINLKVNKGRVVKITNDKISIASGSATAEYIIDDKTVFMNKGKPITLTDVKPNQEVNIVATEKGEIARLISISK